MALVDFISGRDLQRKIYLNGSVWSLKTKSIRVESMATEVTDQVGGEIRARFQTILDGFRVTVSCYDDGSSSLLENLISNQDALDAGGPQLPLAAGLIFKYRDLTRGGFAFSECTLDPWSLDDSGRTERVMTEVKFRCRFFRKVPT